METGTAARLLEAPSKGSHRGVTAPLFRTTRVPMMELWSSLCDGRVRIADQRRERLHHLLVVVEREASQIQSAALSPRRRQILQLILSGMSQNSIAIELELAPSTVCADFRRAMLSLGLPPRLSALPLALPQLWRMAESGQSADVSDGWLGRDARGCSTVALPGVDLVLAERLSPAELDVCRRLLDGHSHDAIARERQTSIRTTANQLATAFAKMNVSGRLELIAALAAGKLAPAPRLRPVRLPPRASELRSQAPRSGAAGDGFDGSAGALAGRNEAGAHTEVVDGFALGFVGHRDFAGRGAERCFEIHTGRRRELEHAVIGSK
jgi:DNA-binding NarL/FixJ family response regulator